MSRNSGLNTSSSDADKIVVKVTYKEVTRKFRVDNDSSLAELRAEIAGKFDIRYSHLLIYFTWIVQPEFPPDHHTL